MIIIIFSQWLKSSLEPIDISLTSTTTLGQCGPGSNDNEWVVPTIKCREEKSFIFDMTMCKKKNS